MTLQEKLHAVETAIRKALPRLMEPTEGCWLRYYEEVSKIVITDEIYAILLGCGIYNKRIELEELCKYEILGHDILLNDVLEWITLFNDFCLWQGMLLKPVGASNYYAEFETINGECFDKNIIEWNLSKPRLADQSEELWNFLYNLIKE